MTLQEESSTSNDEAIYESERLAEKFLSDAKRHIYPLATPGETLEAEILTAAFYLGRIQLYCASLLKKNTPHFDENSCTDDTANSGGVGQ